MEQTPKTSFIPRQNMNTAPGKPARKSRTLNVFGFLAMILFLGSLILSVGVFFYKQYSEEQLTKNKEALAQSRSSFQQGDIEAIRELDRRMRAADSLLDSHLMVSTLLDVLERRTQENTQFNSFAYERRSSGNASVELGGKSSRLNTVALQSLQFANEDTFDQSLFSSINIVTDEEEGGESAVFVAYAELNEDAVRYAALPAPEPILPDAAPVGEALPTDVSTTTDLTP